MATKITSRVIAPGAVTAEALAPGVGAGPVIANVQIANSSYVALDDTAVALSGGYILINGENFGQNTQVIIANTNATSVTYVSSSLVRAQVPARAAGSYILYLVNTDTGATAIRVNAVTYSGTPTWSTGSTLTEGVVDEAISIQLSASSDTSVSYQLQTGSTLPTGLTLAANGLLSGTVTGLNEDTLYNFTIEAIDAENQESPRSFSITITAGDQNINSVVLALNADSNTFITDASTNNFAITPNGDTRPSAFSPYNTSWSNYFDGTGDQLRVNDESINLRFETEPFTVECWINQSTSGTNTIVAKGSGSGTGWLFRLNSSNQLEFINVSTAYTWTNVTVTNGKWHHVVLMRNASNQIIVGIDGVLSSSLATITANYTQTDPLWIGVGRGGSTNYFFGYISNMRIIKGTALYSQNFTPPTSPLTAISGTSFLSCHTNRYKDDSTNNYAVVSYNDVRVTSFGPFAETDTTTGSGYFDGTGDRLDVSSNVSLTFGTGDFTIEGWHYLTAAASSTKYLFDCRSGGSSQAAPAVLIESSSYRYYVSGSYVATGGTPVKDSWVHFALVKTAGSTKLYINGVSVFTYSDSVNYTSSTIRIGSEWSASGSFDWQGYISNFRIVKGTALYTSNFTPPTSPLTAISGTSLLTLQNRISYNNSQPVDESGVNNIITRAGNASVGSYTPHTPAGWSAYFGSSTSNIVFATNAFFAIGTSNFTVEGFVNFVAWSGTNQRIFLQGVSGTDGIMLGRNSGSNDLLVNINTTNIITYSWNPNIGQWYHLAVVREGTGSNQVKLYINGSLVASGTSSASIAQNQVIIGGLNWASDYNLRGYASSFRYSKISRNISLPTVPFSSDENTLLLTLRGPSFTDDGPNRFTITRNGDTRITPFSPFKTHTIEPDSHSVYFDGTGDFLSTPGDNSLVLDGNFTIEFYMYLNSLNLGGVISSNDGSFLNDAFAVVVNQGQSPNKISFFERAVSSAFLLTSSTTLTTGQWYHVAFVRNSGVIKLYLNGIEEDDYTTNNTITLNGGSTPLFRIGQYWAGDLNGYISNLRIVKGTAVYTSNFTPSTTPLTNIANTSLLTCQSSTVIDNSNNAFAITVNGNAQPTKYNPFGETITTGVQYSPASHGGSYYFDGTGDRIDTPSSLDNSLGTSNFTLEFWFNPAGLTQPTNQRLIGNVSGASWGSNGWTIGVSSNNIFVQIYNFTTTNSTISTSTNILLPQWYHIALTRNGSTFTLFVNGVSVGTYSSSGSIDGGIARAISIGGNGLSNEHIAGYISGVRLVKGTALYTSSFVPPAAPPSPVAGTTLLLNGTNAAIADGVGKNVLETIGNARIINGTKKYGTGSMYFDGTGDYLSIKDNTNYIFGTGDFTIECWLYLNTVSPTYQGIFDGRPSNGAYPTFLMSGAALCWYTNTNFQINAGNLSINTWYHVAVTRSSGSTKIFVNGTQGGSTYSDSTNYISRSDPLVGGLVDGYGLNGYIDDLRITKGVARYTTNFTPPTSGFKLK